jgi:hypothetical protein
MAKIFCIGEPIEQETHSFRSCDIRLMAQQHRLRVSCTGRGVAYVYGTDSYMKAITFVPEALQKQTH